MANSASSTIRIIRMGNGQARAAPSPKELSPGETFTIKNWTECAAAVDFTDVPVSPRKEDIPADGSAAFTVDPEPRPDYYEYEVTLTCEEGFRKRTQYVEGGSRPGLIIDR